MDSFVVLLLEVEGGIDGEYGMFDFLFFWGLVGIVNRLIVVVE